MSIVVIGDRRTGKTSMVRALTEHGKYVKINNILASDLYNPSTKGIAGTAQLDTRTLNMELTLPGLKTRGFLIE